MVNLLLEGDDLEALLLRAHREGGTAARIVRAGKGGAPEVTDGPYPEAKEFLAGFWIIDVESTEQAHAIAARISAAPGKSGAPMSIPIELRQVMSAPAQDV